MSPLTDLVLANAIYFKGKWEEPFDEKHTKEDKFHRLDDTDVDMPFMRGFDSHRLAYHDGFKLLQLRYEWANGAGSFPPSRQRRSTRCASSCLTRAMGCGSSPTRWRPARTSYTSMYRIVASRSATFGFPCSS
ncbi:hypothetical protein QYE76_000470 [Lolium multiflorum]|uniref:Serpin domain-containing protein n=1 Tax=Lolium multiflorum TaxID=4521 RepID=A0AAD8RK11_LOLMU|nr:hypothetical protein QYE76_000470 [Lolium multiflorum]